MSLFISYYVDSLSNVKLWSGGDSSFRTIRNQDRWFLIIHFFGVVSCVIVHHDIHGAENADIFIVVPLHAGPEQFCGYESGPFYRFAGGCVTSAKWRIGELTFVELGPPSLEK